MNRNHTTDRTPSNLYQWLYLARIHRKFLFKVTAIGLAAGLLIAFSIPKEYECSVLTAPESIIGSSSGGSNLSTEVSLGGTKIRDAILPTLYPAVIKSTPFLLSLADIPVHPAGMEAPIPLSEYLRDHQQQPWWNYIRAGISMAIGWVLSPFREKEQEEEELTVTAPAAGDGQDATEVVRLSKRQAGTLAAINARIRIDVDKKRHTIGINVRMQDAQVASTVADSVQKKMRQHITRYRTQKERKHLAYTRSLLAQSQEKYHRAQQRYADYADRNQHLAWKSNQRELVNLRIERDMAYREYQSRTMDVHLAKLRVVKQRPVFAVIQPAVTPLRPASPAKLKIILACTILALAAGFGRIWFKVTFS